MKRVLVIVVTYNGMPWLERCLSSVAGDADLFVMDNDSTDGSADFVAAHFPQAKLVRSADNLGFSRPNNLGMQYALDKGYEYVYLLNQDAWLEAGALGRLLEAAQAHPEFGLLSPLQMTDGYQSLDYQFSRCFSGPSGGTEPVPVRRVMAAHWLVPVAVLRRVGLFNEDLFPHWGQDDDWCNRLHFSSLKIGVIPEARAVHDRAQRKDSLETLARRNYYTASLVKLADPGNPLWVAFLYVCLYTLVKAVKYRSALPFKYFRLICSLLPQVRSARARALARV